MKEVQIWTVDEMIVIDNLITKEERRRASRAEPPTESA